MNAEQRIKDLIDRYEYGEEIMTATDVCDELQDILDDEPCNDTLLRKLQQAINTFIIMRHEYNRYAGHTSDGGDEFIINIETLIS